MSANNCLRDMTSQISLTPKFNLSNEIIYPFSQLRSNDYLFQLSWLVQKCQRKTDDQ